MLFYYLLHWLHWLPECVASHAVYMLFREMHWVSRLGVRNCLVSLDLNTWMLRNCLVFLDLNTWWMLRNCLVPRFQRMDATQLSCVSRYFEKLNIDLMLRQHYECAICAVICTFFITSLLSDLCVPVQLWHAHMISVLQFFSQFLSILELVTIEVNNFGHLSLVHEILGAHRTLI